MAGVRSHHLVLRLGVDVHRARVAVGDSLAVSIRGKGFAYLKYSL